MDKENRIKRSKLWYEILSIVSEIPRKETTEDAVDASSAATRIEQLFIELFKCHYLMIGHTNKED